MNSRNAPTPTSNIYPPKMDNPISETAKLVHIMVTATRLNPLEGSSGVTLKARTYRLLFEVHQAVADLIFTIDHHQTNIPTSLANLFEMVVRLMDEQDIYLKGYLDDYFSHVFLQPLYNDYKEVKVSLTALGFDLSSIMLGWEKKGGVNQELIGFNCVSFIRLIQNICLIDGRSSYWANNPPYRTGEQPEPDVMVLFKEMIDLKLNSFPDR